LSREIVIDNIYYCLSQYDWSNDIAMKISYLNSALNLTMGLLLREGLCRPIKVVLPHVEEGRGAGDPDLSIFIFKGFEVKEISRLEDAIDLLTNLLVKLTHLAKNNNVGITNEEKITIYKRTWKQMANMEILEDLEQIKAILLHLLVTGGYDEAKLATLGKKDERIDRVRSSEGERIQLTHLGQ